MLFQQKSDDQKPRQTHSRWSHSWWFPFASILTISTIPIHDDLNNFDDSHWRRSGRFRFPLATIWTILIPIGDNLDDSNSHSRHWFLFVMILNDSWRFGPFTTIPGSSDHSWQSRNRHHRPTTLYLPQLTDSPPFTVAFVWNQ